MSTSVELLHALLHLPAGRSDVSSHRAWLVSHRVVAALGEAEAGAPAALNFALRQGRPLVLGETELETPWTVLELLTQLTSAAGGLVEVPDYREFVGDRSIDTATVATWPAAHPVLISRPEPNTTSGAPEFTDQLKVPHVAGLEQGWSIVKFDREVPVVGHEWAPDQLPAVWLHADRTIAIQGEPGERPQVVLRHLQAAQPVPLSVVGPEPIGFSQALAALKNPQFSASSELGDLTSLPAFSQVDLTALAAALQAPVNGQWSAKVLTELGLPPLGAEIAEGQRELPGHLPPPAGNVASMVRSLRELNEAADHDPGAAALVTKLYGTSTRHPLLALTTIVPEILVGIALLVVLVGSADHPWWHWLVGIFAVACLTDAAIDSVMMVRRIRRGR